MTSLSYTSACLFLTVKLLQCVRRLWRLGLFYTGAPGTVMGPDHEAPAQEQFALWLQWVLHVQTLVLHCLSFIFFIFFDLALFISSYSFSRVISVLILGFIKANKTFSIE